MLLSLSCNKGYINWSNRHQVRS